MATIEDYVSGSVCSQLEKAFAIFAAAGAASLEGSGIGGLLLKNVGVLAPKKLTREDAVQLIRESRVCAVGPRVCMAVHTGAPPTEAVFLDELAEGMARAGRARRVTRAEAVANLERYRKSPLIASKVSGKYAEICPTWARKCLYWNMEKHRLKCIQR